MKPLLESIDTRFGTASKHAFSREYPAIRRAFWDGYCLPQTSDQEGSWFSIPSAYLSGIQLTHQPSPWIGTTSCSFDTCHG